MSRVDFSGNAHAEAVRKQFLYELSYHISRRNAEFVEALRREGKTKRELMAERLAELEAQLEGKWGYDPPVEEIYNLMEAVEEFLNDNK